jgi:hypothetical protein
MRDWKIHKHVQGKESNNVAYHFVFGLLACRYGGFGGQEIAWWRIVILVTWINADRSEHNYKS